MKKEYMKKRLIEYCRERDFVFELYCNGAVVISATSNGGYPYNVYPSISCAYRSLFIDGCLRTPIIQYDYKGNPLPF